VFVGVARVELWLPDSGSLKDRRRVVKSLVERLRSRFNVAVAEVSGQDLWQRAAVGIACVSGEKHEAQRVIDMITAWVDGQDGFFVTACEKEIR